ncbi:MAG: zf-HC2 domain-containing protein, partial [Ktedonobacteraceae bacterium]
MNCNQARTMLSAYRELKSGESNTTELDEHLETCASCREALASYTQLGEQMRATSVCVPSPDLHAKLMRALADEQIKMLQKSAPGTVSTPEFLKPYLQEKAQESQDHDEIVAFSTAKTGPLPLISMPHKRRQLRVNQFTVLGMAAAILLLMMMGGLTSLLMLAHNNPASLGSTSSSLSRPSEVDLRNYSSQTPYANVVSAIPTEKFVYYTAYGNDDTTGNSWMLMQLDRNTQISTPLLATPSNSPLLILAASQNWLVWLQYDRPQAIPHGDWLNNGSHFSPQRFWSLHYLSLAPQTAQQIQSATSVTPTAQTSSTTTPPDGTQPDQTVIPASMVLTQGIFDSGTAPNWATTPITGTWLNGDTLLVTQIDQQGLSHLESYRLDLTGKSAPGQIIASAAPGHIL